jgi:thioesterase domain-containing protein/acyl carrier protein
MPLTVNGKLDRRALPEPEIDVGGEYIGPGDEVEKGIVYIVADILGVDPGRISVRANFFNIGLNSITILKLAHRISGEFGIDFPIGTLFTSPSVEGVAADMKKGYRPGASGRAVLLNRIKAGRNLFLISGDGGIYIFKELALLLEGYFNVYGIQGKGLMETGPLPGTRREVYDDFLHEIKLVQPEGPYLLGGYCYGAIISYELCRTLEERKEVVTKIVLLDEPALMTDRIIDHLAVLRWYNRYRRVVETLKNAVESIKMKLGPEKRAAPQKANNNNTGAIPEDLEARSEEINANYKRLYPDGLHYTRIVKAPVLFIKAEASEQDPNPRWAPETIARMSRTSVKLVNTPGDHLNMFGSPHVPVLAERFIEET